MSAGTSDSKRRFESLHEMATYTLTCNKCFAISGLIENKWINLDVFN